MKIDGSDNKKLNDDDYSYDINVVRDKIFYRNRGNKRHEYRRQ
jgi:hypothetical protein